MGIVKLVTEVVCQGDRNHPTSLAETWCIDGESDKVLCSPPWVPIHPYWIVMLEEGPEEDVKMIRG